MRKLYSFFWECGRMGDLEGLFICDEKLVEKCLGKTVYFGEVLGKHSDIYGDLEEEDLEVKSEDQDFINKLSDLLGDNVSGYNPINYIVESLEADEYEQWESEGLI